MHPRILLLALSDSAAPARLPRALRDAGFAVGVLSGPGALLARSHYVDTALPLRVGEVRRGRTAALAAAIAGWAPDLVVPADPEAVHALHRLATAPDTAAALRHLLERSLGATAGLDSRTSRARTHAIAAGLGLEVVPAQSVDGLRGALEFTRTNPFPVCLRTDRLAEDGAAALCTTAAALQDACDRAVPVPAAHRRGPGRLRRALAAWRSADLAAPPAPRVALWIEARPEGNSVCYTAAAMDGRVLAGMAMSAAQDGSAAGLGAVVRLAGDAEAAAAARLLIARLGFSGLCGVHFIRAQETGGLLFCGFTPHPTAVSHLGRLAGCDPCAGLHAAVTGQPAPPPVRRSGTTVALFSQVWAGSAPAAVQADHDDIPWEDGGLIAAAFGRLAA